MMHVGCFKLTGSVSWGGDGVPAHTPKLGRRRAPAAEAGRPARPILPTRIDINALQPKLGAGQAHLLLCPRLDRDGRTGAARPSGKRLAVAAGGRLWPAVAAAAASPGPGAARQACVHACMLCGHSGRSSLPAHIIAGSSSPSSHSVIAPHSAIALLLLLQAMLPSFFEDDPNARSMVGGWVGG